MRSVIFWLFFLSGAVAACLYINFKCDNLVDPCEIDAPMEQSQCRAMGGRRWDGARMGASGVVSAIVDDVGCGWNEDVTVCAHAEASGKDEER